MGSGEIPLYTSLSFSTRTSSKNTENYKIIKQSYTKSSKGKFDMLKLNSQLQYQRVAKLIFTFYIFIFKSVSLSPLRGAVKKKYILSGHVCYGKEAKPLSAKKM